MLDMVGVVSYGLMELITRVSGLMIGLKVTAG